MTRTFRLLICLPVVLAVLPTVGCSTLGLSPPAHKLTDQAKAFRAAGPASAPLPKELNKALLPSYVVEPGDTLLVLPSRLDTPIRLPGDQPVLQDGTIDLGEYGRPVVAGKTVPQIEGEVQRIVAAHVKDKDAGTVNVRLVGRVSKVFYVLGEVNAPGAFPIAGRETVLDGIITAGGITRNASTSHVILSRPTLPEGCRIVLPVCYDNIVQLGDTSTNYQLQPGDRIYVPSKGMLEGLGLGGSGGGLLGCRKNQGCDPCNRPQSPCLLGGNCADGGVTLPAGTNVEMPAVATPAR